MLVDRFDHSWHKTADNYEVACSNTCIMETVSRWDGPAMSEKILPAHLIAIAESNNIEARGYVMSANAAKDELLAGLVCVAARERKCSPSQDMQPHSNTRNAPGRAPHAATEYGIDSIPVPRIVLHTAGVYCSASCARREWTGSFVASLRLLMQDAKLASPCTDGT